MRRTLLQSLLPAAVAIMMSLGIVMTAAAETDPASPSRLVPGAMALDRLVELGVLPAEVRDALVRIRLEHSESVGPGVLCHRVADAEQPPAALVERCRTWLSAEGEPPAARFAVCRRIVAAEWVDADFVERCRGILAGAADRPSDAGPQDADSRAGEVIRPIRDLRLTSR